MVECDFAELVFQNGQILMQKRSSTPSCISYTSQSKARASDNGGDFIHNQKRPRLSATSDSKDTSKDNSLSPICNSNSQRMNTGSYNGSFPLFLKLGKFLEDNNRSGFQDFKFRKEESSVPIMKTTNCSNSNKDFLEKRDLVNQTRQVIYRPQESHVPDEQSEAPVHGNVAAANSMCSLGASNDHTCYSFESRNEDSEGIAYSLSENVEEEQMPKLASARAGDKRRRTPEIHNVSERKRRDKINKKMRALQALIPNSDKVDKASMLDNAIEYLKSLQLQLQMMSMMRSGFCMPPNPIMQQIQAANMGQFLPMGMGTVGCSPTLPFLNSAMLGLGGQMLPMAVSHPPFMPLMRGSSTPSVLVSGTLPEVISSAPLCSSINGVQSVKAEFQESIQATCKSATHSVKSTATNLIQD